MLVQKQFSGAKFDPKTYTNPKMSSKKNVYKNWTHWFLRAYCEISAHTDVPNILSTPNCLFAMNWNPAGLLYATNGCVSSSDPNGRPPSKSPLISQELAQECPALLLIPHYNTAMQCALNTARCTLNNAQCTMHTELSIMNNSYFTLNTEQDTLHTENCSTHYIVHWTMKCAVTSHLPLLPHPTSLPIWLLEINWIKLCLFILVLSATLILYQVQILGSSLF